MRRVGVLGAGRLLGAGDPVADTRKALELELELEQELELEVEQELEQELEREETGSLGPAPLSQFPGGLTLRQNGSGPGGEDRLQAVMVQKVGAPDMTQGIRGVKRELWILLGCQK
jgi:hypothetical protein